MEKQDEINLFNKLLRLDPNPGTKNRIIITDLEFIFPGWIINEENSVHINRKGSGTRNFYKKYGYNSQILYDILILGITNIDDRPKCPICGKPAKFTSSFISGYLSCCGDNHCVKILKSQEAKKLWEKEEYRNKVITKVRDVQKTDKWKENFRKAVSSKEHREKLSKAQKNSFQNNPDRIKKSRKASKEVWQREGFRDKWYKSRESMSESLSQKAKERWATSEFREKMKELRPQISEKQSLALKEKYKDETFRKHRRVVAQKNFKRRLKESGGNIEKLIPTLGGRSISGKINSIKAKNNEIRYDSSWEKMFIEFCDKCDCVSSLSRGPIIAYKYKKENHNYFSDFIVTLSNGIKLIIEIKASWKMTDSITKSKIKAGNRYVKKNSEDYRNYLVFTEDILFIDSKYKSKFRKLNEDKITQIFISYIDQN